MLDHQRTGLKYTSRWLKSNGDPNIDLYVWITDFQSTIMNGVAYRPGACDERKKTSLTAGPHRGVIETAEVSITDNETQTNIVFC